MQSAKILVLFVESLYTQVIVGEYYWPYLPLCEHIPMSIVSNQHHHVAAQLVYVACKWYIHFPRGGPNI